MNLSLMLIVLPMLIIIMLLLGMVAPFLLRGLIAWLDELSKSNMLVNILITCLLWIPIESLFMCTLGTTPGKWLFGIKVRDEFGNKLKFGLALKRSGAVYLMGLGAGMPLVSLITLVQSYRRLTGESITLWDERLGTEVSYSRFGGLRALGACLVVALTAILTVYGAIN